MTAPTRVPAIDPRYDQTSGTVMGAILRNGLPSMIGFAALHFYDVVNMFWVSRLGPESLAAVTIFFSFYWVVTSANMIAGAGSVAIISRRFGEQDIAATEAAIKEAILLKLILAVLCGAAGYVFLRPVLVLLGAKGEVLRQAIAYGSVSLLGLGASFASWTVFTALRGIGDPRRAMATMLAGVGLNMALDPLLIFGWGSVPGLGIAGAALASVIAFTAVLLSGLVILFGGFSSVRLHWRGAASLSMARMMRMLRIGVPSGVSALSFSLSRAAIMPMVAGFGSPVVAAYGMANRVGALGVTAVVGMGLGVSALTGQTLGAGKPDRAWSIAVTSARFGGWFLAAFAAVTFVAARPIASLFFHTPEEIALGAGVLRVLALSLPFVGLFIPMESCTNGAGQTAIPMVFSIIQAWVLQVPMILLATQVLGWDERSVWWSLIVAEALATMAFAAYFRRRTWLATRV